MCGLGFKRGRERGRTKTAKKKTAWGTEAETHKRLTQLGADSGKHAVRSGTGHRERGKHTGGHAAVHVSGIVFCVHV